MEADGLISRQVYAEVPPRVECALTGKGESLLPAWNALRNWSETHLPGVGQTEPETASAS